MDGLSRWSGRIASTTLVFGQAIRGGIATLLRELGTAHNPGAAWRTPTASALVSLQVCPGRTAVRNSWVFALLILRWCKSVLQGLQASAQPPPGCRVNFADGETARKEVRQSSPRKARARRQCMDTAAPRGAAAAGWGQLRRRVRRRRASHKWIARPDESRYDEAATELAGDLLLPRWAVHAHSSPHAALCAEQAQHRHRTHTHTATGIKWAPELANR